MFSVLYHIIKTNMDRHQIENLLDDDDDVLSNSFSNVDDTDEDPDWQSNEHDNEAENNVVDYESDDDDVESEWNGNFDIPNINSNIV